MRFSWNLVLLLTLASGASLVAAQTTQHASPGDPASAVSTSSRAPDLTKLRLNYIVAGPDRPLIHQFKAGLSKRLRSIGVDVTNRFPAATLILYVMQDCWRWLKTDHLCWFKTDQGWRPRGTPLGCG